MSLEPEVDDNCRKGGAAMRPKMEIVDASTLEEEANRKESDEETKIELWEDERQWMDSQGERHR